MTDIELKKYASLIVNKGVNLQKGQGVIIYSSTEAMSLVNFIIEEANKKGASMIITRLTNEEDTKRRIESLDSLNDPQEDISDIPSFVRIRIRSESPNYLSDVDQDKYRQYNAYERERNKPINLKVKQWTIVPFPTLDWAKYIFKDKDDNEALALLWKHIKTAVRLDDDPIKNWTLHDKALHDRCDILNKLGIKRVHYQSSNGTDLYVSLNQRARFIGGSVKIDGVEYEPNIPSEEVYTAPDSLSAEGVVYASKPLYLYGHILKDFGFKFSKGEVVEITGEETTKELFGYIFKNIPGSNRLGEIAFVPYDSPINQTGILFFKNLLDENASCHIALGDAITDAFEGLNNLSKEEYDGLHINRSPIHIDFMMGTKDLKIAVETFDNREVLIFKDGNFVL